MITPRIGARDETDWTALAALRFVLAGIVACTHIGVYFTDYNSFTLVVADMGAKAAVVGFFLLSGYSIAASLERHKTGYYRRRLLRIYPIYLFAIAVTFGLEHAVGGALTVPRGAVLEPSSLPVYFAHLFFLETFLVKPIPFDSPVWSLAIEVGYYLAAPLLMRLPRGTALVVIAVSAMSYSLPRNDSYGLVYFVFTRLNLLLFAWPWFMGYFLFHHRQPAVWIGFAALGTALIHHNDFLNPEAYPLATFLGTLAVMWLAAHTAILRSEGAFARRALNFAGNVSYPLYLLQYPIMLAAFAFWGIENAQALLALCVAGSILGYLAVDVAAKRTILLFFARRRLSLAV